MRYSTQPKFRKYVKEYGFLSIARKFGNKYGKKLIDTAVKTGIDLVYQQNFFKKSSSKNCRSTGKITSLGKTKSKEKEKEEQETYIPPEKRQQIIDDLRLFKASYKNAIPKNHKLVKYND